MIAEAPLQSSAGDVLDGVGRVIAGRDAYRRTTQGDSRDVPVVRLLVFTSLYPNAMQPRHGIFVEERLRHLIASGQVTATVVAPVPWFPFKGPRFGRYGLFARVPASEERHGIHVLHPRYPVIPKVGMNLAPFLMYWWLLPVLRKVLSGGEFDLIDAHYFYPDGVTAARLGRTLGKPVVITARGSDVNVIPNRGGPRQHIKWATKCASAIVTVSQSLKDKLVAMGTDQGKITVVRNGVDLDRFASGDRDAMRREMTLSGSVWLTVGHLVELKGVHLVIEAVAKVPEVSLLIAGDGPEKARLLRLAKDVGVASRIRLLGAVPQSALPRYYNAADALFLASSSEGMPNVALESLACGTPVVAAPFAGVSEVIDAPEAGEVAASRTAEALAEAWQRLQERAPDRAATRRFAERFGWGPVVARQFELYCEVMATDHAAVQQKVSA